MSRCSKLSGLSLVASAFLMLDCTGGVAQQVNGGTGCGTGAGTCNITDGSVVNADIANATITGAKLVGGTITSREIGTGAVRSDEIEDGSIQDEDIANATITGAKVVGGTITSREIGTGAVRSDEILDESVTAADLAANSVGTSELQDGAVTNDKLSPDVQNRFATIGTRLNELGDNVDRAIEGTAIALSIANPDLVGDETFGLTMNYGHFEGSGALGFAAQGVLTRDLLGPGAGRLAISGGVGFGTQHNTVGGRAGMQLSW